MQPFLKEKLSYDKKDIDTVLINSNFTCGYFLDRYKLFQKLKYNYNIQASYDPCSYPGIQCKFYYNSRNLQHNGVHIKNKDNDNEYKDNWKNVSFMIFRTGSVLVVGNCDKTILHIVYNFIKMVLNKEFNEIFVKINDQKKKKPQKKVRKKTLKLLIE